MAKRVPCPNGGQCGHQTHTIGSAAYLVCAGTTKPRSTRLESVPVAPPSQRSSRDSLDAHERRARGRAEFTESWQSEEALNDRGLRSLTSDDAPPAGPLYGNWKPVMNTRTGKTEWLGAVRVQGSDADDDNLMVSVLHAHPPQTNKSTWMITAHGVDHEGNEYTDIVAGASNNLMNATADIREPDQWDAS